MGLPMSSDIAINVEDISKCYFVYESPADRIKQALYPRVTRASDVLGLRSVAEKFRDRRAFNEYWALRNLDFQVRRGETVGIVGKNGSGKSTLLQMIAGTLTPT